jgi:hypothetical protein
MGQISPHGAASEVSSRVASISTDGSLAQRGEPLAKHCCLVAVAFLLFIGLVLLSALAKDGLYYPQSSSAHRISKASKMSQHQIPELGNERQELAPAFPRTSRDVNEGSQLNDVQQILLPRDAAVLASPPLRSPPPR